MKCILCFRDVCTSGGFVCVFHCSSYKHSHCVELCEEEEVCTDHGPDSKRCKLHCTSTKPETHCPYEFCDVEDSHCQKHCTNNDHAEHCKTFGCSGVMTATSCCGACCTSSEHGHCIRKGCSGIPEDGESNLCSICCGIAGHGHCISGHCSDDATHSTSSPWCLYHCRRGGEDDPMDGCNHCVLLCSRDKVSEEDHLCAFHSPKFCTFCERPKKCGDVCEFHCKEIGHGHCKKFGCADEEDHVILPGIVDDDCCEICAKGNEFCKMHMCSAMWCKNELPCKFHVRIFN